MNNNKFFGKTCPNFLTKDEVNIFLNYCKSKKEYTNIPEDKYWNDRIIYFSDFDENIKKMIIEIVDRMKNFLKKEYNFNSDIYPDEIQFTRLFDGMDNPDHCDDMSYSETQKEIYGHRYFGCVIYLNNDFEGGELYYTNYDIKIKPEPGLLAVHLGDLNHKHGVSRMKGNTRYSLASFWTFDKNKALKI
jgi:hypothetical protein